MPLRPLPTDPIGEFTTRFFISAWPSVLVVSVHGTLKPGSLGNPEAAYLRGEIFRGIGQFQPTGLVFDWRELSYVWGNYMLSLLGTYDGALHDDWANDPHRDLLPPLHVVTSDLCRPALFSLCGLSADATPAWHFDDLDSAVAATQAALNRWLDAE